jgi:uncharacterized protein YgiM (DUF1202 family)
MDSSNTALVKYQPKDLSGYGSDNTWFDEHSRQELKGTSRIGFSLLNLILAHLLIAGFAYAYFNWMPHPGKDDQEWVAKQDVNIRSKPSVSSEKVGLCEQGTRFRVIGERGKGEKQWYEVEISPGRIKEAKPTERMWIKAEYVTMMRK